MRYNEAIINPKALIGKYGKNASVLNNLGLCYTRLGDITRKTKYFELAIESFREGIDLDPDLRLIWGNLGLCYYEKARINEMLDDLDKSEKFIIKAQEMAPGLYFNFQNLGLNYTCRANILKSYGNRDDALKYYRMSLTEFDKAIALVTIPNHLQKKALPVSYYQNRKNFLI